MNQDSKPRFEEAKNTSRPAARAQIAPARPTGEVPADLRSMLLARWNALGEEIFSGHLADERRLSDLGRDCELLATISTWFRTRGNITRAAEQLNSSRRALRQRINAWRKTYPDFVPTAARTTRARKRRTKDEATTRALKHGSEGAGQPRQSRPTKDTK